MRIPLPDPSSVALMSGLTGGANLRAQQYRNAMAQAQSQSLLGNLLLAQQMEPYKQKLASAQAGELGAQANALNQMTPLKKQLLLMQTDPKVQAAYINSMRALLNAPQTTTPQTVGAMATPPVQSTGTMTPINWNNGSATAAISPAVQAAVASQQAQPAQTQQAPSTIGGMGLGDMYVANKLGLGPYMLAQQKAQLAAQQAQREAGLKVQTTQATQQSAANVKRMQSLQDSIPQINDILSRINQAIPMLEKDPSLVGPGIGDISILGGPEYRKLMTSDPQRLANMQFLKNLAADIQALKAKGISGSRMLASALKLAGTAKTSPDDPAPMFKQTLMTFARALTPAYQQEMQYYNQNGGPKLGLADTSGILDLPPISDVKKMPNGQLAYLRGGQWSIR